MIGKFCLVALLGCVLTQANPLSPRYKRSEPESASITQESREKDFSLSELYDNLELGDKFKELTKSAGEIANASIATMTGVVKGDVSIAEAYENSTLHRGISIAGSAVGEAANSSFHAVLNAVGKGLRAGSAMLSESQRIAMKVIDWTADNTGEALQTGDSIVLGTSKMATETFEAVVGANDESTDVNSQEA